MSALNLPLYKYMLMLLSKIDQCTIKWSFCHALQVYDQFDLRCFARFPNFSSVSVAVEEGKEIEMDYTNYLHIYIYE